MSSPKNDKSTSKSTTTTTTTPTTTPVGNEKKKNFVVPRKIDINSFITARKIEISKFMRDFKVKKCNSRAFQSLPRYLRRRTMSHNIYRLPIYLRKRAQREIEKSEKQSMAQAEKRNVRKSRRRPAYLLRDYNRRQKQFKWLETHIWHAKRMKMINLWNYRVAQSISGKGVRATYRASSHYSTLYDASYHICIEITGLQNSIIQLFKLISPPLSSSETTIASRIYINGCREGSVNIYYPNRFPFHFICPSRFLWKQENSGALNLDSHQRMLWLWVHPSVVDQVMYILELESIRLSVTIKSLQDHLLRFELTGSKSHQILNNVLKPLKSSNATSTNNNNNSQLTSEQVWNVLGQLRTSSTLVTGTVLSLDTYDPRLICKVSEEISLQVGSVSTPPYMKNQDNTPSNLSMNDIIVNWNKICSQVAVSKLWSENERKLMKSNIQTNHSCNQQRKTTNLPTRESCKYSSPTVMLIQRDGALTRGYGSGWDIIIPSGWGMQFWLGLIYSGCWAIGLFDRDRSLLEQGLPSFPRDYPDTLVSRDYYETLNKDLIEKYKRTPPAKKTNYLLNGIYFPFEPCWNWILNLPLNQSISFDDNQTTTNTTKKSDKNEEEDEVEQQLKKKKHKNLLGDSKETNFKSQNYFVYRGNMALMLVSSSLEQNVKPNERGLVRVSIKMMNGGKPLPNSVIYQPLNKDVEILKSIKYQKNFRSREIELPKKMPTNPIDFYNQQERKPIGFVVNGEQSLARGVGSGIGYCSAIQFTELHKNAIEKSYSPSGFAYIQNPKSKLLDPVILTIQP
ncbi:RNase P protein subunit [Tieghemostelium lacteum]|uniref:RNase P protein subunit n=1 Tax=Tieghemostelium lacteum TaxID=361077 RepID=A0A151ZEI5_TIELA|nr:RNase P protein subunit [Tieghemostelium lacteum]|eukprot:KYQ92368.1 RNase P protein subunit [Tieghemostelium lacteum]